MRRNSIAIELKSGMCEMLLKKLYQGICKVIEQTMSETRFGSREAVDIREALYVYLLNYTKAFNFEITISFSYLKKQSFF